MRIIFDIGHPADVHLFRHLARELEQQGHEIFFTARHKECDLDLLKAYGFRFKSFGKTYKSIPGKIFGLIRFSLLLWIYALKQKPDLFISHSSFYPAIVSFLMFKPHICIEDTGNMEQVGFSKFLGATFLTSRSFKTNLGKKQAYYAGYYELTYLHPNYFQPDEKVLSEMGLQKGESFVILRFVSWTSSHDLYQHGFTKGSKPHIFEELSKYARVFISSEIELPDNLKKYRITLAPEKIHHALSFASLFVGEGATMASECAMLGTPAIYVNSSAVDYCTELEEKFQLVHNFRDEKGVIDKAVELLNVPDLRNEYKIRNTQMLSERIDVTKFFVWFIENFPRSFSEMKDNPDRDLDFKV